MGIMLTGKMRRCLAHGKHFGQISISTQHIHYECFLGAPGPPLDHLHTGFLSSPGRRAEAPCLNPPAGPVPTQSGRHLGLTVTVPSEGSGSRPECTAHHIHTGTSRFRHQNRQKVVSGCQSGTSECSGELFNNTGAGTSLVVQWLRLRAPNAGGPGSIPAQGTKIPHAATKTRGSQINK